MKLPSLGRKQVAWLLTSGLLIVSALIVRNGNYGALSIALTAMGTTFMVGHTVAQALAPDKEEGS